MLIISSEFLITDLALASSSIPSFVITSLVLLSSVLQTHPPSAIVLHANFLANVLELILDDRVSSHHTLIIVGDDPLPAHLEKVKVKIFKWSDLEKRGSGKDAVASTIPGACIPDQI